MFLYDHALTIVGQAGASLTLSDNLGSTPPITEGGLLTLTNADVTLNGRSTSDVSGLVMDGTSTLTLGGDTRIKIGTAGVDPTPLIGTQIIGGSIIYEGASLDPDRQNPFTFGEESHSSDENKYSWDADTKTLTLEDGFSIENDIDFEVDGDVTVIVEGEAYVGDDLRAVGGHTVRVTVTGGGTLTIADEIEADDEDDYISLTVDAGTTVITEEEVDVVSLTVNGTFIVRDGSSSSPLIDIEGGRLTVGQNGKLEAKFTDTPGSDDVVIRFSEIPAGTNASTLCNIAGARLIKDGDGYILANANGVPLTEYSGGDTLQSGGVMSGSNMFSDPLFVLLSMYVRKTLTIEVLVTEGGTVTGDETVRWSRNAVFTITPDEGYRIADVIVGGKSVGAVSEYTFKKVRKNQTISVRFEKIPEEEPVAEG